MNTPVLEHNTADFWQESAARTFTNAGFLVDFGKSTPKKDIITEAPELYSQLDTMEELAQAEYGSETEDGEYYKQIAERRRATVAFLERATVLKSLTDNLDLQLQSKRTEKYVASQVATINNLGRVAFGAIDEQRLEAIIARTRLGAANHQADSERNRDIDDASERLLNVLPEVDPNLADKHIYKPSLEVINYWQPFVQKKYGDILELVPEKDEDFNSTEISAIFSAALGVMGNQWGLSRASEWSVEIGGSNINVDGDKKVIWVPESATKSTEEMQGLVVHEAGVHLLRNLIGELTGNPLISSELPGRGDEEEAYASTLEQIIKREPREAGIPYYLGIGMALNTLGLSNPVPHNKLEEFLADYEVMQINKPLSEKQEIVVEKRAYRISRGLLSVVINGNVYQTPFPADMKYAKGQMPATKLLTESVGNPAVLDDAVIGKHALSVPEQLAYVKRHHQGKEHLRSRVPTAA